MILEVYLITYLSLIYTISLDVCASLYGLYGYVKISVLQM